MSYDQTRHWFDLLFQNRVDEQEAREYLINLHEKGESETDLAAAASVMREHCIKLSLEKPLRDRVIDIVGTGGDKSGSFNISTTTALILASLGSAVAKHGNRAITSNSGSADVLEALGINLNLDIKHQARMLEECGFTFMFAINHHPAMRHIMPIRRSIEHPTIFNILGPLTNPAGATKYLLGVYPEKFLRPIANALSLLNSPSSLVVSSRDGMDELSISGISDAIRVTGEKTEYLEIDPQQFGFKLYPFEAIKGADAHHNASITRAILENKEEGAKKDIVLLNSAAALWADGQVRDMKEGIEMAKMAIESGKAKNKLEEIIKVSNSL
jgi:anthranilate phosphoribosyltransferase